jgi:hypothetical protein
MERKQPAHQRKNSKLFKVCTLEKVHFEFTIIGIVLVSIMCNIPMFSTQRFFERRILLCQSKLHHKPCMK